MNDNKQWLNNLGDCYESYSKKISEKNKASSMKFFKKYVNNETINNLITNMNTVLKEMKENPQSGVETKFVNSLHTTFKSIPFLKMDKGGEIKRTDDDIGPDSESNANIKKVEKSNKSRGNNMIPISSVGGSPGDETQLVETMNGLKSVQMQIASLNTSILVARQQSNHDLAAKLTTQLQQLIMIENMAEQRQQALDIAKRFQVLRERKEMINQFKRCLFTGFSGVTSYYILKMFKDAGVLITGGAAGFVSLLSVGIMSAISNTVNGVTENLPRILGGGMQIMDSGRDIVGNFTEGVGNYVGGIPEIEQFTSQVSELGYTTNIVAFIILFSLSMIFFHTIRIFESGDNLSLGFVSVGTNAPGYQQLPQQFGNNEIGALSQQIQALNNNVSQLNNRNSQTNTLQDSRPDDPTGGYKKKRTRRRGRKRTKRKKRTKRRHHLYKNKK